MQYPFAFENVFLSLATRHTYTHPHTTYSKRDKTNEMQNDRDRRRNGEEDILYKIVRSKNVFLNDDVTFIFYPETRNIGTQEAKGWARKERAKKIMFNISMK